MPKLISIKDSIESQWPNLVAFVHGAFQANSGAPKSKAIDFLNNELKINSNIKNLYDLADKSLVTIFGTISNIKIAGMDADTGDNSSQGKIIPASAISILDNAY